MKIQKIAATGCLLAMTASLFFQSMQVEAAKAVKTVTCPTIITLQKGKFYKVNDFLKLAGTVNSNAEKLRTKIKKGMKCRISGKGLNIKKKMFKAKKTGEYKLKIKLKKKVYVFPVYVADKGYQLQPEEVTSIKISSYATVPPVPIQFNTQEAVSQFVEKINQAKYTIRFPKTLVERPGFVGCCVVIYYQDGHSDVLWMTDAGFKESYANQNNKWIEKIYTSPGAKEFYDYVEALYANTLKKVIQNQQG